MNAGMLETINTNWCFYLWSLFFILKCNIPTNHMNHDKHPVLVETEASLFKFENPTGFKHIFL